MSAGLFCPTTWTWVSVLTCVPCGFGSTPTTRERAILAPAGMGEMKRSLFALQLTKLQKPVTFQPRGIEAGSRLSVEAVRDRSFESTLAFGTFDIDMDPLMVACDIGELIDLALYRWLTFGRGLGMAEPEARYS